MTPLAGKVVITAEPPHEVVTVNEPDAGGHATVTLPVTEYVLPVQAEGVAVIVPHEGAVYVAGVGGVAPVLYTAVIWHG
jgi:hypothetical protein